MVAVAMTLKTEIIATIGGGHIVMAKAATLLIMPATANMQTVRLSVQPCARKRKAA